MLTISPRGICWLKNKQAAQLNEYSLLSYCLKYALTKVANAEYLRAQSKQKTKPFTPQRSTSMGTTLFGVMMEFSDCFTLLILYTECQRSTYIRDSSSLAWWTLGLSLSAEIAPETSQNFIARTVFLSNMSEEKHVQSWATVGDVIPWARHLIQQWERTTQF